MPAGYVPVARCSRSYFRLYLNARILIHRFRNYSKVTLCYSNIILYLRRQP